MAISRVLVPVRGKRVDEETIKLACRVAKSAKAKIYAMYIIEVKRTLPLDAEMEAENLRGEEVLEHSERVAEEQSYTLEGEMVQAREAGQAIVDVAEERNIDLIILGLEYKQHFGDFSMGTVTPYVLKNAPCAVWLCREAPKVRQKLLE